MPEILPRIDGPALNTVLTTARLRLEPLDGRHAARLFDGLQDPAIYRWISMRAPQDAALLAARWTRVAQAPLVGVDVLDLGWAVQRRADGAWVGKMDAEVTARGVATNVGYLLVPAFWGQGLATEALTALSEHLKRHGVVEQHATVTVGNAASCRVLERAGFVHERVISGNDTVGGVLVDDHEYVRRTP